MHTYKIVEEFPRSDGKGNWTVKLRDDGVLTCGCPIWIFNRRGDRTCKHTDRSRDIATPRGFISLNKPLILEL